MRVRLPRRQQLSHTCQLPHVGRPLTLIADPLEGGQLFGAPQKSPEPNLVLLPLLGGDEHRER